MQVVSVYHDGQCLLYSSHTAQLDRASDDKLPHGRRCEMQVGSVHHEGHCLLSSFQTAQLDRASDDKLLHGRRCEYKSDPCIMTAIASCLHSRQHSSTGRVMTSYCMAGEATCKSDPCIMTATASCLHSRLHSSTGQVMISCCMAGGTMQVRYLCVS